MIVISNSFLFCFSMRPDLYDDGDLFVIMFSVIDRKSFEDVKNCWVEEIEENAEKEDYRILLVGTKGNLRESNSVSKEEGKTLAKEIKAIGYVEIENQDLSNIQSAFLHPHSADALA